MKGELPPDEAPRIVKPRKPKHTHRPIIALTDSRLIVERFGTLLNADQLPHILASEPSSIIACQGFGPHLDRLRTTFSAVATFQYRVTPRFREARNNTGEIHPTRIYDAIVNFVGFRGLEKGAHRGGKNGGSGKRWTRYHYPLDPIHFLRDSIDNVYPTDEDRIYKLLRFAQEVREFCLINQLEVKPSAGGLAAQLLKDARFYPEPRRKAPRMLNQAARQKLPGNYYYLRGEETPVRYSASYLDITNAHHEAAREVCFPDVNTLHAYGRWGQEQSSRSFIDLSGSNATHQILARPGLFHARITVPHIPDSQFPPPYMRSSGNRNVWLYSNELELVEEHGGSIQAIYAAVVSDETESGLNRYAEWAISQIAANPQYKPWLKPTLHATYGVLAARPTPFETGYYNAAGKLHPTEYPMGPVSIPAYAHRTERAIESQVVNVIHRGMIEAEVRCKVLRFARELSNTGYNVLAAYADSLFVEGDQMPILPPPWRVSAHCTNLRFYGPTHFVSDQQSRLPGIARNMDESSRRQLLVKRELLLSSVRKHQPTNRREVQHAAST